MRLGTVPATAVCVFVVAAVAAAGPALAETRPIKGETIKSLISGGTVELDTPIGATLPLTFAADGTVIGRTTLLSFYLGSTSDRGRWWISGNSLCMKWNRWFDAKQSCLLIRPEGRKFAWTRDDGDTGTASIVSNPKRLYASASALTGGVSAAAMVRNAEERAAAQAAKPVQAAALQVQPQPKAAPRAVQAQLVQILPRPAPAVVAPDAVTVPDANEPQTWLPKSALKLEPQTAAIRVALTTPQPVAKASATMLTYKVARVNTDDVLNMRSGSNADAAVTGSIPAGARGLILKGMCQAEWCPVGFQNQYGWVNRLFIELE